MEVNYIKDIKNLVKEQDENLKPHINIINEITKDYSNRINKITGVWSKDIISDKNKMREILQEDISVKYMNALYESIRLLDEGKPNNIDIIYNVPRNVIVDTYINSVVNQSIQLDKELETIYNESSEND